MNLVVLMGRLTADPDVRYTQEQTAVARFTLAVDRIKGEADFIRCVAFGKSAEFVGKYFSKGSRILLNGRIQTGSYTDKDGKRVYTTDVIADHVEFCESKSQGMPERVPEGKKSVEQYMQEDFMSIGDEEIPFN